MEKLLKSIWIAEDDEDDLLMLKEAFEELNYKKPLLFFENGEKIIESLIASKAEDKPSLILLDLNMPKVDGLEVLNFIKNNQQTKDINVIILTTSKSEEDKSKALKMGANDFITKPYQFKEMLKITVDLIKNYG